MTTRCLDYEDSFEKEFQIRTEPIWPRSGFEGAPLDWSREGELVDERGFEPPTFRGETGTLCRASRRQ